jgi:hypothetical protein
MEEVFIQQIVSAMPGQKLLEDCKGFKPGVGFTCKARDIGLQSYVKCLDRDSNWCPFSVSFGYSYYCKSPARVYIAKESNK